MDVVQVFNDQLQSLLETKPPVSKAKMGLITRAAMKGVKFYKHIVQIVEKFIGKCNPEYKVPGLYVIDSIVRQSRHQFGVERDVYAARFSRNFHRTFNHLFVGCLPDDKPKIVRVLNLWQKNGVFSFQTIQPLIDLANPNASLPLADDIITPTADSPLDQSSGKQGQSSKYLMQHYSSNNPQYLKNNSSSSVKQGDGAAAGGGLRFSKNMLDFDYDDEDDDGDETPTEAEPPLSSTLNKIELEQRGRLESSTTTSSSSKQAPQFSSSGRNDQDPVLERWNRLIKQQSITGETQQAEETTTTTVLNNENNYRQQQRHRSRSPVGRDRYHQQQKQHAHQAQEPVAKPQSPEEKPLAERDAEKQAERKRKCLPKIRDKHLTVCSSTLWLGHVPRTVSEADISDAFGEYGTITSIDLIPPRGCAYVCMDRRQDAKRALMESKDLKLNGSHIKMAWAPGKGFKEYKRLKEFWEVDTGSSYIPYNKIDSSIDFDVLEEGGVIDEDSMSMEMREMRERKVRGNDNSNTQTTTALSGIQQQQQQQQPNLNLPMPTLPILSQPPPFALPPPNLSIPPPTALMPFPPPTVVATSASGNQSGIYQDQEAQQDTSETRLHQSPNSIDHQLSMTERQINMVEQQLSMIQQAQSLGQPSVLHQPPPPMFHQASAAPTMLFDIHSQQLLHSVAPPMLDPLQSQQLQMFANQPAPMLPISQASMDPNVAAGGRNMPHYGGRY